ncbi:hypothetical protein [Streptomyces sp. NPDC059247]|uniref:hypothetical protein n=1 Tax=Streptomyces sp. NPDC059247 TaxID=3346790 RepID=UPI0036848E2E
MSTWEERLAGASTCEPRRSFDAAEGLRRLASDAGYLPPARGGRSVHGSQARWRLEAVARWGVTQSGAVAHMRNLADVMDCPDPAFTSWADGDLDLVGWFVFACLLYLAGHPESARYWWQAAAGAGHALAAYCLHLQHLVDGELELAAHWRKQIDVILADPERSDLDPDQRSALIGALDRFTRYAVRAHSYRPFRSVAVAGLQKEFERLAHLHDDGGLLCRPDRHLANRLRELTSI